MNLKEFFREYPRCAIAFSGGVDSAYLLYAAIRHGTDAHAYYVKSAFQPQFELDDALRLAKQLGAKLTVLPLDVLACGPVSENPPERCYHCKKVLFSAITEAASKDGFSVLLDGTNASDKEGDRPGMRALRELQVRSPLRSCGLTKARIRELSREAGLFTWDKPAYACLATRIPTGEAITAEKLAATEASENALFALGFTDFRVRRMGTAAKLQLPEAQLEKLLRCRKQVVSELKKYYSNVLLDLEGRT